MPAEASLGQREHLEQCPTGDAPGERYHGRAVGLDAGRREVFVRESGVGLRAGVKDGDTVEGVHRRDRVDDRAHGDADFVVGVGCEHDPCAVGGGHRVRVVCRRCLRDARQSAGSPRDVGVGPSIPGVSGEHDDVDSTAAAAREENLAVRRHALREVDDEGAQLDRRAAPGCERRCRRTA